MLKLTLTISSNLLELEGDDLTIGLALPVITDWLAALPQPCDLAPLQEMTARLTKSTKALALAVRVTADPRVSTLQE